MPDDQNPNPNPNPTPSDKIAELRNLMTEATAVIAEGKQTIAQVEELITELKTFLGK